MPLRRTILTNFGTEVLGFIESYIDIASNETKVVRTNDRFNIESIENAVQAIANLEKVNNFRRVNKFHESVNARLLNGGIYIGCAGTQEQRKIRNLKKFPKIIGRLFLFFDFVYKRVLPKLPMVRRLYFAITRGHNRVMCKVEILGRLICCGFEVIETREINNLLYFVARKIKRPAFDLEASYGPIFGMKRVGKGGQIVKFYKFRTMYPYAEYLQDIMINDEKLNDGGKIQNDYRVCAGDPGSPERPWQGNEDNRAHWARSLDWVHGD